MQVMKATSDGGPAVLIEVDEATVTTIGAARPALGAELEGRAEDAIEKLGEIGDSIAAVCESIHEAVAARMAKTAPDEFTLEFGVKIGGEGSAIISKVTGEAALKVTATWRPRGAAA